MRAFALLLICALLGAASPETPLPVGERLTRDALAFVEAQAAGMPGEYSFRVVKPPVLPSVPGELRFEASHLSKRDLSGRFFASFKATVDGRPIGMVRVDLEGRWKGKVLRTKGPLQRKTEVDAGQVEEIAFEGNPPAGALAELPAGFRLRSALPAGHLLTRNDLEAIPVVLAGERVRLAMVSGDLTIAVETLARSNGAVGEHIRLELPGSRKALQAVVTGPGEAQAQWAGAK